MVFGFGGIGWGSGRAQEATDILSPPVTVQSLGLSGTNISSLSKLSDRQLSVVVNALDATPAISATNVPTSGTFWSLQHPEQPPFPTDLIGAAAWELTGPDGSFLLNDVDFDYNTVSEATATVASGTMMTEEVSGPPSPPGSGSGSTNSYNLVGTGVNYGTNLFLANAVVTNGWSAAMASNTIPGVSYTIQWTTNLLPPQNWQNGGTIVGSALTNWTAWSLPKGIWTNLFIRLRSEISSDGSGLPNWWETLYFGTNAVNPDAQDSAGDGYTIYQKYIMGVAPNAWVAPLAPQGFTAVYNANNDSTKLNWLPSSGQVTNYIIQQSDETGDVLTYSVPASSTSLTNYNTLDGSLDTEYFAVQARYSRGNSAWSTINLLNQISPVFSIINGGQGKLTLIMSDPPADLSAVRVYRTSLQRTDGNINDWPMVGYGTDYPVDLANGYFDIPVANITNGIAVIPTSQAYSFGQYEFDIQAIESNGLSSAVAYGSQYEYQPFVDGRQQLKDNLRFLLRAATDNGPFEFYPNLEPTNYAYAGLVNEGNSGAQPVAPFYYNAMFHDFVRDGNSLLTADVSYGLNATAYTGMPDTGVYYDFEYDSITQTSLVDGNLWYSPPTAGPDLSALVVLGGAPAAPASLLNTSASQWIVPQSGNTVIDGVISGYENHYGLPLQLQLSVSYANNQFSFLQQTPGTAVDGNMLYLDSVQPTFSSQGYYFGRSLIDPLPEENSCGVDVPRPNPFSVTNTTPLMVLGVGNSLSVEGYAKLGIQNGNPNMFGYVGQYVTNAYEIGANGALTSTNAGILSPYGDFFATKPGLAGLLTMADIDTGAQGTCAVYCVCLQLDANHDGNMDLSFNGTDATSTNSPYVFWANNNFDRWAYDVNDSTNYMDDVLAQGCPYTANIATPDFDYLDMNGDRVIPNTRDLEDYTRLWVCGITTNLLAALPAGSSITLSWGDVGNPNAADPTIDLFTAAEADGGIGYLTNATIAAEQINTEYAGYVGRLAPGGSILLNNPNYFGGWTGTHFIWCGVSNGTGGLTLTITDAKSNVLAQTTAYIQIVDIRQMYERYTVGDQLSIAPMTNALLATEGLPVGASAFQYPTPQGTNTPYILFVHGWNLASWEKDRFAETAFRRLYWQGYQGRFGVFCWPTGSGFAGVSTIATNLAEKDNYDSSEFNAWLSGKGLLNKLNDLNMEYPSHVYLLAHSMGNVVAGEALRLAGAHRVVNTYVASQAAISAHTYDENTNDVPNYSFYYPPWSANPKTPNIYGDWFTGDNGGGAGTVISLYNPNDFALQRSVWQLNQLFKPDQYVLEDGTYWNYDYNGSAYSPPPWNEFYKQLQNGLGTEYFDIVNILTNRYEVCGYAAQSWTTALGATPGVANLASQNLTTIWPSPDPLGKSYSSHFWHSAEFRGDLAWEWRYWNTLLFSPQLGFNMVRP